MTRKLRDAIGKCGGRVFQLRHSQVALMVKNPPINAGDIRDAGSIPGLGRSPGGYGNPLQYSCLKISHGQGRLAGYSPWGHKQSDMT